MTNNFACSDIVCFEEHKIGIKLAQSAARSISVFATVLAMSLFP